MHCAIFWVTIGTGVFFLGKFYASVRFIALIISTVALAPLLFTNPFLETSDGSFFSLIVAGLIMHSIPGAAIWLAGAVQKNAKLLNIGYLAVVSEVGFVGAAIAVAYFAV